MKIILIVLALVIAVIALLVLVLGEVLVGAFPAIRKFKEKKKSWAPLNICIKNTSNVKEVGQLRFEEVSHDNPEWILNDVRNRRLADVMVLVHHKDRYIHGLFRELRGYSAFYLILLILGISFNFEYIIRANVDGVYSFFAVMSEIALSHHIIPILELVTVIVFLFRLRAEILYVRDLVEGE